METRPPGSGARRREIARATNSDTTPAVDAYWEDGGPTELDNLVLLCPCHHRAHDRGVITLTGPAQALTVTDDTGRTLSPGSLARPPTKPPPAVAPYPGPTGERADWWWYEPFQPQPGRSTN